MITDISYNIKSFLRNYAGWLVLVTIVTMVVLVNVRSTITYADLAVMLALSLMAAMWTVVGFSGAAESECFPDRSIATRIALTICYIIGGPIGRMCVVPVRYPARY